MGLLRKAATSTPAESGTLEGKIAQYHEEYRDFNCIILEKPAQDSEEDETNFCKIVADIVSTTGTVIPLSRYRPLILFPKMFDRELIAHRLSRNLNAKILLSCETSSPENVLNQIHSML